MRILLEAVIDAPDAPFYVLAKELETVSGVDIY